MGNSDIAEHNINPVRFGLEEAGGDRAFHTQRQKHPLPVKERLRSTWLKMQDR